MFWILFLLWPRAAEAHVQWFVTEGNAAIEPYQWSEPLVWLSVLGSVLLLGVFGWLTKLDQAWWQRILLSHKAVRIISITSLGVGLLFSVVAFHWELILVYIGLVLYGILVWKYPQLAVRLLMVGVGLSFTQAAFAEKLLHPELAATFLHTHHWNFLYNFGFTWYTNRVFILHAGLVEGLLGLALALGFAPRLVIAQLSVVCLITAYILGLSEVLGHAPIVMAFVMILCSQLRPITKQSAYTN